jgi:hypothetical protein
LKITAIYGANMRGHVFRIVFRKNFREFESIETSPGFAQLLGEKLDFQNDVGKKSLNGESLEMNAVISRSFLIKVKCCKFILRK